MLHVAMQSACGDTDIAEVTEQLLRKGYAINDIVTITQHIKNHVVHIQKSHTAHTAHTGIEMETVLHMDSLKFQYLFYARLPCELSWKGGAYLNISVQGVHFYCQSSNSCVCYVLCCYSS